MSGTKTAKRPAFWNPCLDSSDDDEEGKSKDSKTTPIKKTRTNKDAIKNPNDILSDHDEDIKSDKSDKSDDDFDPGSDTEGKGPKKRTRPVRNKAKTEDKKKKDTSNDSFDEEILEESSPPPKSPKKKRKKSPKTKTEKRSSRKKKAKKGDESDDDFDPGSDGEDNDEEESDSEESVASDDISDDNISDSDFMPDSDDEKNAETNDTINLSSDGDPTPKRKNVKDSTQTFDPNSKEFWNKVEELRNKGFSIQQTNKDEQGDVGSVGAGPRAPVGQVRPRNGANHSKLAAFTQLYINFEHEKRCTRKCFMMEGKQKQALGEIDDPSFITPDFVKACIRVVMCCMRLGDTNTAREAIGLLNRLGEIPGISALCQAMISGVKVQHQSLDEIDKLEENGMEALRDKEFTKAMEYLDNAITHAGSCLRLKMARGDCLAHLGRYVDGAKAASSILQQDQRNVGALFLRGFCLYHKNNIERALTHFQQVLQLSKDHERAKTLLGKSKQFKEKKDLAVKAVNEARLEDAERIYTEAIAIDQRNKGTNANLLADRAEVYFRMKRIPECVSDCEASLELDQGCLAAMLQRAKCHMENKEWEAGVRIFERMNNRDRHNQQSKKKAGEAALKAGNHDEAYRLFSEALDVDKHNQKYRHLLREAKQQHLLATRVDYYQVLGIEKTCGDSEIKKAYFKKSKEYHPDRHANAEDEEKEEFSNKFKLAKEAYEVLSDSEKRKGYDTGGVKPPPGGWYQDVDQKIFQNIHPRGGIRGMRGMRGGIVRGRGAPIIRGNINARPPIVRGNIRPNVTRVMRGGVVRPNIRLNVPGRGGPIRVQTGDRKSVV